VWAGLNTRIDWNGTTIRGPVYIGSGCDIEAGATIIGPTWIGHGSRVCAGGCITRSVIFEYTCVNPGCNFKDMVICGDYVVNHRGKSLHVDETIDAQRWSDSRAPYESPARHANTTRMPPLRSETALQLQ